VHGVPAGQRQRADLRAAAQQRPDAHAEHRRVLRDVDRHDRRPVGALIPRQQIAGQAEGEDHLQQQQPDDPVQLARLAVAAEEHDPDQVQHRRDDDHRRAPMVQPTEERAAAHALLDEAHAVPRVIRRRRVVERQRDAGDHLHAEAEEQHAPEREPPRRARRQRLLEQVAAERAEAGAVVEPVGDAPPPHSSTSKSDVCGLTRTLMRASGTGGGPETTRPLRS
jgi:hypothetical protein